MKKTIWLLATVICFIAGCAGYVQNKPTLVERGVSQPLSLDVTLLPVLDSRRFPDPDQAPNLYRTTTIVIPADDIASRGVQVLRDQGTFAKILPYQGALPDSSTFKWTDFPLAGLTTDMAVGLEIKSLDLRKTGYNNLYVSQIILDSALLPFFAGGLMVSDGHTDLAAQVVPSTRVALATRVELNVVSRKAGGLVFRKPYQVDLVDPAVSAWDLHDGFFRSPRDGQDYGRETAPRIIETAFLQMAHDPELTFVSRYARIAWLGRLMSDQRVSGEVKTRGLNDLARELRPPDLNEKESAIFASSRYTLPEKMDLAVKSSAETRIFSEDVLGAYDVDPSWLAVDQARRRIFELSYRVLLNIVQQTDRQKILRPLTADEQSLEDRAVDLLGELERHPTANQQFRADVRSDQIGSSARKALFLLLARDPETLDNAGFVAEELGHRVGALNSGDPAEVRDAASLLVALKGERAPEEYPIPQGVLWSVLSADDQWAAPMVLQALESGDYTSDIIRLAGALQLEGALPILMDAIERGLAPAPVMSSAESRSDIPLLPAPRKTAVSGQGPDPVLCIQALSAYRDHPHASAQLRSLLGRVLGQGGVSDRAAAEVVLALARQNDRPSGPTILDVWRRGARDEAAPLLRRACLEALETLTGPDDWASLLAEAEHLSAGMDQNQPALRELVDFFGRIRFEPAVPLLGRLIRHPNAAPNTSQAALNALGLIASPDAERELRELASDASSPPFRPLAAQALETLVKERAFWDEMAAM